MQTIKFPKMFNSNSTNVWKPNEHLSQTKQSTELLISSEKGELFGDPFYGLLFKHYLYNQNSPVIRDILTDMLFEQIAIFIPQLRVKREDISIVQNKEKGKVYCHFTGINQIDFQVNTFDLVLYQQADNGND